MQILPQVCDAPEASARVLQRFDRRKENNARNKYIRKTMPRINRQTYVDLHLEIFNTKQNLEIDFLTIFNNFQMITNQWMKILRLENLSNHLVFFLWSLKSNIWKTIRDTGIKVVSKLTDNFNQVVYRPFIAQHRSFCLVSKMEITIGILWLITFSLFCLYSEDSCIS